ncbi:hypothetical protein R0381_002056 [Jeongeupia wiesaeckerbachi]|uniref:hypothetical protein n=1 Tax=Jeongeupia wiesaeckerbachi TaxID=3051218 RepID=UPI003D80563D
MDLSADLMISPKGEEEIKNRTFKLSIRKRSVLLLLGKPRSLLELLEKTVYPRDDIISDVVEMARDDFLAIQGVADMRQGAKAPAPADGLQLDPELIVSEARFLLIDFCVDAFGPHSQAFVDEISACKTVDQLLTCVHTIHRFALQSFPAQVLALHSVVTDINKTA